MASREKARVNRIRKNDCSDKKERLEKWLLSPDQGKRIAAIDEIKTARCPEKKPILIKTLGHDDKDMRKLAVEILGSMREEITLDDILDISVFLNSKKPSKRLDSVLGISRVLSEDYAPYVSSLLSAHLDREDDKKIIKTITLVLWSIEAVNRKNRSFKDLIDMLSSDNEDMRDATLNQIRRYREILTGSDINLITDMLDSNKPEIQVAAIHALKFIDKPVEIASRLMKFFDDIEYRDESTIIAAIEALDSMRRLSDIEEFMLFMRDSPDPKYDKYREEIDKSLRSTMRIIPTDAITPKENIIEEIQFNLLQQDPAYRKPEA